MKQGWVACRLAEICDIQSTLVDPREDRYLDLPHVGAGNIESGTGRVHAVKSAREEGLISGKFLFDDSTVLYSKIRPYLMKVVRPDFEGLCSADIYPLAPKPERVQRDFLFYLLLTESFTDYALLGSARAGMPKVNREHLFAYRTRIPAVDEQRRIVAILDDAFEGIATAKANSEKNLQNARELFDSKLLSLLRDGSGTWIRRTLKEVAVDFGRGKSKHRPRNDPTLYGGPYPFIQTGDVRGSDHLITEYTQTYSEAGLAQSKLWPRGTLCITIAANIAETGVLDFDACFPDSVIGVVVDESHTSSKFLEYLLHTVKADLKAKGKGSAQDNINLGTFENERFPFPDLLEQERAVALLDELSSEIQRLAAVYERKLATLDELKKSLLHQAFSGKL